QPPQKVEVSAGLEDPPLMHRQRDRHHLPLELAAFGRNVPDDAQIFEADAVGLEEDDVDVELASGFHIKGHSFEGGHAAHAPSQHPPVEKHTDERSHPTTSSWDHS